ncbi:MAG TPA: extracellular solute-binding protein [Trueperaceae bacterium]|nr:extracellular solute-binding protein [Trueperaceae bacterium]
MRTKLLLVITLAALLSASVQAQVLTIYVGRGEALAQPIIDRFEAATGIDVEARYGSTAELAGLIMEEGAASPADAFWAQDAGALGALEKAGSLAAVPAELTAGIPGRNRHPGNMWVPVSARNRVLVYSTDRVDAAALPSSVFDLTGEQYRGKVAWAPGNASFQSFVTAMRQSFGEDAARQWLTDMIANGAVSYSNNGSQLDAIAAGEVDFGLVNNYYLLRRLATEPNFPVAQTFFADGDIGNLANVTGIGVVATTDQAEQVQQFIAFLLSDEAQAFFTNDNQEYPITTTVAPHAALASLGDPVSASPLVDLASIDDLQGTLDLLTELGLL